MKHLLLLVLVSVTSVASGQFPDDGLTLELIAKTTIRNFPAIPGLPASKDIELEVYGHDVWVERVASDIAHDALPTWFHTDPATHNQVVCLANFVCDGPITVTLTASASIDTFSIHPKSRNIEAATSGNELTFSVRVESITMIDCRMARKKLTATSHGEQFSKNEFADEVEYR